MGIAFGQNVNKFTFCSSLAKIKKPPQFHEAVFICLFIALRAFFGYLEPGIRHQSHIAGIFDRVGYHPLMFVANLVPAGCRYFELRGHKTPQQLTVLIIYPDDVVITKITRH